MNNLEKLLINILNMESEIDNVYNNVTDSEIDDLLNYLLIKLDECGRIISTIEIK